MSFTEPPVKPVKASPGELRLTSQERNLAMLAHLTGGLGAVLGGVVGFLGPLVIWLTQKDDTGFVAEQAKEALNFQITLLIIYAATVVLAMLSCFLGWFLPLLPWVLQLVFGVISSLSVSKGVPYRYPFNLRLVT